MSRVQEQKVFGQRQPKYLRNGKGITSLFFALAGCDDFGVDVDAGNYVESIDDDCGDVEVDTGIYSDPGWVDGSTRGKKLFPSNAH